MSWRKFKFISPGVFVNEIDNSQLPQAPGAVGPVVIGRTAKGPGLKPIKVNSFSEFVQTFGNPIKGGAAGDVWRDGFINAPTYAAYAAQAWLRNNTPITVVRLLGKTNADAETAGYAGWKTTNTALDTNRASNGGAFGLFLVEGTGTISIEEDDVIPTGDDLTVGTLAAIWYLDKGSIELSGNNVAASAVAVTGTCQFIEAADTNLTFKAVIKNSSGDVELDAPFDFTSTSPRYIRKVFNTNPTLTNSSITTSDSLVQYWLGESYEGSVKNIPLSSTVQGEITGLSGTVATNCYGVILPLGVPDNSINGGDFQMASGKSFNAASGWFFSQDMGAAASFEPSNLQKLFRFVGRDYGEDIQKRVKISIRDIKASTDPFSEFGSFTVLVRDIKDTDRAPMILEQYNNCNLNPASDNYIARKIGNTYFEWSDTDNRYTEYGDYPNQSDFLRIDMNEDVNRGTTNPVFLPFGVVGPPRYIGFANSGSALSSYTLSENIGADATGPFVTSGSQAGNPAGSFITGSDAGGLAIAAKFKFPELRLRVNSNEGSLADPKNAYFGVDTTYNGAKFDESVVDVLRTKADSIDGREPSANYTEAMWYFSLDDVRNEAITASSDLQSTYKTNAVYDSGSRVAGTSYTAQAESGGTYATASYTNVLDAGWNQFTTCLHGGFSGMDITEREPFNNTRALSSDKDATTSYAFNSVSVAINSIADAERVEMNMACMPGITNNDLNRRLADVCEDRGDALAILDLQGGYTPDTEDSSSQNSRLGSVDNTVDNLKDTLKLNNSYACAYYPWVQIRDTISGGSLWAPPSVVALGAISYGQATSQLWFAPAGFTRGGLSANNAAGIPVINVKQKLTSKERDKLYDHNINPIASFPAEGIVIFGQKTLQVTPSALDRINVRRLLIHLKREISRMAATVLFDQNVESTWARFTSVAEPFLREVKAGLGITDYRLILDSTTTTPDLVDRNIMYAKIIIKPARAIEFIAIDFVITDSGAAFED